MGRPETQAMVVLVHGGEEVASWPLADRAFPDLALVNDLARWQLSARRLGCSVRLRNVGVDLWALLDFLGLAAAVGVAGGDGLGVEVGGETEEGEQAGVEEVVEPDDPVA